MIVPPVIQLFPLHVVVFVEYKYDTKRAYWITGGGWRCSILDLLFWERGWLYSNRHITIQMYKNYFFTKCYGENNK